METRLNNPNVKPNSLVYKMQFSKGLINHGSEDVQHEYISEEERIQDECINDEIEEMKNIELMMGCIRKMCGKY